MRFESSSLLAFGLLCHSHFSVGSAAEVVRTGYTRSSTRQKMQSNKSRKLNGEYDPYGQQQPYHDPYGQPYHDPYGQGQPYQDYYTPPNNMYDPPSYIPTPHPTRQPTALPTERPTNKPSPRPSPHPTAAPTVRHAKTILTFAGNIFYPNSDFSHNSIFFIILSPSQPQNQVHVPP